MRVTGVEGMTTDIISAGDRHWKSQEPQVLSRLQPCHLSNVCWTGRAFGLAGHLVPARGLFAMQAFAVGPVRLLVLDRCLLYIHDVELLSFTSETT